MKKITQLLLPAALLFCCIQPKAQAHLKFSKRHKAKAFSSKHFIVADKSSTKKPEGLTYASMEYPMTELGLQTSYSLSQGWYTENINRLYNIGDTGTTNYDLSHSGTVAFDSLLDYNSGNSYIAAAGSLTIDTLSAVVTYKNTSGLNDTVVFFIRNVEPSGYPGNTVLSSDTVILNQGVVLPGYSLDTLYTLSVLPNFNITSGYKFAVTLQFSGPKIDTFEFAYAYPYQICSADGYSYCNTFTYIGPPIGSTPYLNSYVTGWEYYEPPTYSVTTWPDTNGNQVGVLGGVPFDNDEWNMCNADTEYFYWQDNAIYASVSFTDVTGINTISKNGLSISQNYPNPFRESTLITYSLVKASDVRFTVCDVTGRMIVDNRYAQAAPGQHSITLDAARFGPGVYFYTFTVNGASETKKMVISE